MKNRCNSTKLMVYQLMRSLKFKNAYNMKLRLIKEEVAQIRQKNIIKGIFKKEFNKKSKRKF
jgi:hypothetical protein